MYRAVLKKTKAIICIGPYDACHKCARVQYKPSQYYVEPWPLNDQIPSHNGFCYFPDWTPYRIAPARPYRPLIPYNFAHPISMMQTVIGFKLSWQFLFIFSPL